MKTSWFKKDSIKCSYNEIQLNVQRFCNEYRTELVLTPKGIDEGQNFIVEVWANIDSGGIVINVSYDRQEINWEE